MNVVGSSPRPGIRGSSIAVFHESQRFRQCWLRVLLLVVAVLSWWAFVQQIVRGRPFGDNPGPDWLVVLVFVLFGIGLPGLLLVMRLQTDVYLGESVSIRFFPFPARRIPLEDIESAEAVTYRPLRDFGGWGIRWSKTKGQAYNAYGNRGVQLGLRSGRRLLIGSQRPEELLAAIAGARLGGSRHLSRST